LSGKETSIQVWHRNSSRSSSEGGYAGILRYADKAKWGDSSTVATLENKHGLSDKVEITSTLTHNKYEITPGTRYVFPNGSGGLFMNDYKYGVGFGTTLEEKLTFSMDKTVVIGGLELGNYDIKPKATYPNGVDRSLSFTDQAGTFDYYTSTSPLSALTRVARVNDLTYSNIGAYLEGTLKPIDDLKFILGGRVDKNTRFPQVPFSPRAAVVYNLTKTLTTKYIFTKAFVYPAPYFGFNAFDNGSALNIGNSKLEPEKATSNEVVLSWNNANVSADASLYYNEQKNLIIVGDRATAANIIQNPVFLDAAGASTRVLTHSANAGESRAKGVDLSTKMKIGKSSLWASYSYVDFRSNILGVKSTLEQTSRNNVRLGASVTVVDKLLVTPSLIYRSTPVNLAVPAGLKGKTRDPYEVNLHAVYAAVKNLDVFVDLRNVTNHKAALRGVLSPTLQEPFSAFAGVRISL
jgi:outer membrane receptor protein involved in Fe transport